MGMEPKDKSQYIFLDWLYVTIVQYHKDSFCHYHTTWKTNSYGKQLTSQDIQCHCTFLGIKNGIWAKNGVFKTSKQSRWKLGVEILSDQFSSWNYEKKRLKLQLCSMTSTYLGKLWFYFSELFFLNCNDKAAFLFKNTYNKEKGLFLFESDIFCYVFLKR